MASQAPPTSITLKIFSKGVAVRRRVDTSLSFAGIQAIIGDAGLPVPPKFSLATFVDEDGDTIRLSNDEDLADALSMSPSVLKVTLQEVVDAPRAPVVAVPAAQPVASAPITPPVEEEEEVDETAAFMQFINSVSGKLAEHSPELGQVLQHVQEALPGLAMCSNPDDVTANLQAMRKAVTAAMTGPEPSPEGAGGAAAPAEAVEWELSTPVVPCARSCALLFRELKVYLSSLKMLVKHPRFGTFTTRAFQLLPTLSEVVTEVCAMDLSNEEARTAAIATVANSGVVLPIIELFVAVFGDIGVTTVSCNQDVLLRAGFSASEVAAAVEAGVALGSSIPADSLKGKPMKVSDLLDSIWAMAADESGPSSGEADGAAAPAVGPYPGKVSEDGRTVWVAGLPTADGEQTVHLTLDMGSGGEGVAASDFHVEQDGESGLWKVTAPEGKTVQMGAEHTDRASCGRRRGEMRAWRKRAQEARCAIRQVLKCEHGRWAGRCRECDPEATSGWRHGRHHGHGHGKCRGRGRGGRHGGRRHRGHGPKTWVKDAAAMAAMAMGCAHQAAAAPPAVPVAATQTAPPDAEDMLMQAAIAASMTAGRTHATTPVARDVTVTTTAPMTAPTTVLGEGTAVTAAVVTPPTVAPVSGTALDTCAPSAKFVAHVTVCPEGALKPGQSFIKAWRMQNSGTAVWPAGCRIVHVGGHALGVPSAGQEVPAVAPGDSVDISLHLEAPAYPGRHVGYYRLVTPTGTRFGHRIWQHMVVDNSNAADVLATLRRQGSLPPAADANTQTSPRKPAGVNAVTEVAAAGEGAEDFVVVDAGDATAHGRVSLKARSRSGTAGTEESFEGACGSASMEASLSDVGTPVAAATTDAVPATIVASTMPAEGTYSANPVTPEEQSTVENMVIGLGVSFAPALAALRQAGGDVNRAAELLLAE